MNKTKYVSDETDEVFVNQPGDTFMVSYHCTRRGSTGLVNAFGRAFVKFEENKPTPERITNIESVIKKENNFLSVIAISISKL